MNRLVQSLWVHNQFAVHAEKETIQCCTTDISGTEANIKIKTQEVAEWIAGSTSYTH